MSVDIGYIGFSEKTVYHLLHHENLNLKAVLWEAGRAVSAALCTCLAERKIPFWEVSGKGDLCTLLPQAGCENFLIHEFSYIVPDKLVQQYALFNLHPGNLRTNRGAHPLVWTILLREAETRFSLYRLGAEIDTGLLVAEKTIAIDAEETTPTLKAKFEAALPEMIEQLYRYLKGEGGVVCAVEDGVYRPRIREKDYTICPETDSPEEISAKIRSQAGYKGAVLYMNGVKYFVTDAEKQTDCL